MAGDAESGLTLKRQQEAGNGSNYIALRKPQSPAINPLTCLDDPY
jgi:hypothetical protein